MTNENFIEKWIPSTDYNMSWRFCALTVWVCMWCNLDHSLNKYRLWNKSPVNLQSVLDIFQSLEGTHQSLSNYDRSDPNFIKVFGLFLKIYLNHNILSPVRTGQWLVDTQVPVECIGCTVGSPGQTQLLGEVAGSPLDHTPGRIGLPVDRSSGHSW